MRMAIGDLTYIQPLGLPAFASGFRGIPFYSGGLGQVVPQGPVQQDVSVYYQAGLAVGAGGTPGVDLSAGFPSADAQAAFNAGWNAGNAPVTAAQIAGVTVPSVQYTSTPSATTISPMAILVGVGTIALLLALRR